MFRLFAIVLALSVVLCVPVAQVPEQVPAPVQVEQPVVKAEEPAKVEAVKVEEPAKVETVKVEEPAVTKVETKLEEHAEQPLKTEETQDQALAQVLKAVSELATPFGGEEFGLLKDMISKGSEMMAEAEKKAKEVHSKPEFQSLLQGDALFGIKQDGTIDADVATDQFSQLMSLVTGTSVNEQDKHLIHELIAGFSSLFAPPSAAGPDSLQSDFEKLATQFSSKFQHVQDKLSETPKDKLLDAQTLLSVMNDDNGELDLKLLSDVTQKFYDKFSSQFEKVVSTLEKIGEEHPEQH
jgi:hypothetical protein